MQTDTYKQKQQVLSALKRRLHEREVQLAKLGVSADPIVRIEIDELIEQIAALEQELRHLTGNTPAPPTPTARFDPETPAKPLLVFRRTFLMMLSLLFIGGLVMLVYLLYPKNRAPAQDPLQQTQSSGSSPTVVAIIEPAPSTVISPPVATTTPTIAAAAPADPTGIAEWAISTATPDLPDRIVIVYAASGNCSAQLGLDSAVTNILKHVDLAGRPVIVRSGSLALSGAEAPVTRMSMQADCADLQTVAITVTFSLASPAPINLLREPETIGLRTNVDQAQVFAQASALYSVGAYGAARATLADFAAAYAKQASPGFDLLWGNMLLRQADWAGAEASYSRALERSTLPERAAERVALLNNRGLARLFWQLAEYGDMAKCGNDARQDLLDALRIAPDRADLHVLLGTIMLNCPREDQDIEQNAVHEVEQALALDPAFAPAYDLQAQVGAENRARPEIGAPLLVERQACRALQLNHLLPGPHRTLGNIYTRHGLVEQARAQFVQYSRAAAFDWQRRDALALWQRADQAEEPASPGLGQCAV